MTGRKYFDSFKISQIPPGQVAASCIIFLTISVGHRTSEQPQTSSWYDLNSADWFRS